MISIVIPVYNQQQYLANAIESALDQTVKPDEIIVVDDGSTDDSYSLAKTYGVTLIHQDNQGLSKARNTGIREAKTDYIIPLDADDLLMEHCIEKVTKKIQETQADVIMWNFKEFGTRNHEVQLVTPTLASLKDINRLAYCSAIKRQALDEVSGYNPNMVWGYEDWNLWIDLSKRGKTFVHIPEVLFLYRTKAVSMLTEAVRHHYELVDIMKHNHPDVYA